MAQLPTKSKEAKVNIARVRIITKLHCVPGQRVKEWVKSEECACVWVLFFVLFCWLFFFSFGRGWKKYS